MDQRLSVINNRNSTAIFLGSNGEKVDCWSTDSLVFLLYCILKPRSSHLQHLLSYNHGTLHDPVVVIAVIEMVDGLDFHNTLRFI